MGEIIQETLEQLLGLMRFEYEKIDVEDQGDECYRVNIQAKKAAEHMIGANGNTLKALQHMLKILLCKKIKTEFSINLDIDNYRKRQADNVIQMAEEKAVEARKHKKAQKLPPMSSYFRRLVHLHITKEGFEDLTTQSEGQGHYRSVVISPVWETSSN